jgi:hypothetical protein
MFGVAFGVVRNYGTRATHATFAQKVVLLQLPVHPQHMREVCVCCLNLCVKHAACASSM